MPATPFFLPTVRGQRFCLLHGGRHVSGVPVASILYIPPFAEELNRSRRMVALQCRALADAGFEVLQLDLGGCGDSAGHFADATWAGWVADVLAARDWLMARQQPRTQTSTANASAPGAPSADLWLWGLRAGCLLAADVVRQLSGHHSHKLADGAAHPANLLFWQPVTQGTLHLAQFLRLKVATDLVRGEGAGAGATAPGGETANIERLKPRQLLADGQPVEIGGYEVSSALAAGLEAAHLDDLPAGSRLVCVEFAAEAGDGSQAAAVSPAMASQMARWQLQGVTADSQVVTGAAFWQTQEVEVVMGAIDHTVKQLMAAQEQNGGLPQTRR